MPTVDRVRQGILVIDDCLTSSVLDRMLAVVNGAEFEPQDLGRGVVARRERAQVDESEIGQLLWEAIGSHLPPISWWFVGPQTPQLEPPVEYWTASGCNPRSRFYRYRVGASFSEHEDEPWKPDPATRSMLTVLVYLPVGGCEGGETVIDGETVAVVEGRVVVFDHGLLHQGKPVERGQKLVLRNDVVAKPTKGAG
ncbi:MAG: hypothetical protein GY701_31155 [Sulfitobacter sp.]|nr:hypothetical protein [Sulfitobacter sp.]